MLLLLQYGEYQIYICIKSDTGIPLLTQIKYCLKRDIKLECQLGFSLHFCTF